MEQEIIAFSSEDVPISVGVILDLSQTITNKVGKARAAIAEFLKTVNIHDDFFLVGFNAHAELMTTFTHDPEYIQSRVLFAAPRGRTEC